MADLSPAAQAVLDAVDKVPRVLNCTQDHPLFAAAALRAAADQVVPVAECRIDPSDSCYERSVKQERSDIRILLRDIAAELEGDGPAVANDREPASVVSEPTDKELSETYLTGYYAMKNRQGPAAQAAGLRAVLEKWGSHG